MTTPKRNPSKHYKLFRKAIAFPLRKLELCRHCRFRAGSFQDFSPGFRFWHICHVDRHGYFTLKQLRLPVLNETHTNSYTCPRLIQESISYLIVLIIQMVSRLSIFSEKLYKLETLPRCERNNDVEIRRYFSRSSRKVCRFRLE
jgi:hypothetical protein